MNNGLNAIGEYKNFSFGIITSISTFENYINLLEKKKNKIGKDLEKQLSNSPYNLMKQHCQKNNYELLIYDMNNKKIYVEDDSNNLIDYDLYKFQSKYKLDVPNLDSIFKKNLL